MADEPTILEQLTSAIKRTQSFDASMLNLLLIQEFRHWRAEIEKLPATAGFDAEALDRVAAKSTVEIVLSFFHDENRDDLQAIASDLESRLLKWGTSKPKSITALN